MSDAIQVSHCCYLLGPMVACTAVELVFDILSENNFKQLVKNLVYRRQLKEHKVVSKLASLAHLRFFDLGFAIGIPCSRHHQLIN